MNVEAPSTPKRDGRRARSVGQDDESLIVQRKSIAIMAQSPEELAKIPSLEERRRAKQQGTFCDSLLNEEGSPDEMDTQELAQNLAMAAGVDYWRDSPTGGGGPPAEFQSPLSPTQEVNPEASIFAGKPDLPAETSAAAGAGLGEGDVTCLSSTLSAHRTTSPLEEPSSGLVLAPAVDPSLPAAGSHGSGASAAPQISQSDRFSGIGPDGTVVLLEPKVEAEEGAETMGPPTILSPGGLGATLPGRPQDIQPRALAGDALEGTGLGPRASEATTEASKTGHQAQSKQGGIQSAGQGSGQLPGTAGVGGDRLDHSVTPALDPQMQYLAGLIMQQERNLGAKMVQQQQAVTQLQAEQTKLSQKSGDLERLIQQESRETKDRFASIEKEMLDLKTKMATPKQEGTQEKKDQPQQMIVDSGRREAGGTSAGSSMGPPRPATNQDSLAGFAAHLSAGKWAGHNSGAGLKSDGTRQGWTDQGNVGTRQGATGGTNFATPPGTPQRLPGTTGPGSGPATGGSYFGASPMGDLGNPYAYLASDPWLAARNAMGASGARPPGPAGCSPSAGFFSGSPQSRPGAGADPAGAFDPWGAWQGTAVAPSKGSGKSGAKGGDADWAPSGIRIAGWCERGLEQEWGLTSDEAAALWTTIRGRLPQDTQAALARFSAPYRWNRQLWIPVDLGLDNAAQRDACWRLKETISTTIQRFGIRAQGATASGWTSNPAITKDLWCGVQVSPGRAHRNAMLAAAQRVLRTAQWIGDIPQIRLEWAEGTLECGPKNAGYKILAEWKPRLQRVCFRRNELAALLAPTELEDLDARLQEQGEEA